jgi:CRISPR-associated protein Csd2
MNTLDKKIDFVVFFTVKNANPNGDPLMGNMPRTDYDGYGEASDVCIKRKIRNRMQDLEYNIFVQSQDRTVDDYKSLEARFNAEFDKKKDSDDIVAEKSCEKWFDVRSFGQVMTFQNRSLGIRGPVSISLAKSLSPVDIVTLQITRSTNGMEAEVGKTRSSDTMGTKHYVDFGVYKFTGSINCYFAEKTGFTDDDADTIKETLRTLFMNDISSARPEGSMEVKKVYWFTHPNKLGVASSAKIHNLVSAKIKEDVQKVSSYEDYIITIDKEKYDSYKNLGLDLKEIEGI